MPNSRPTDEVDHIVPLANGGLDDPCHDGETPERRSLNALKKIQTTAFHQVMLQCSPDRSKTLLKLRFSLSMTYYE